MNRLPENIKTITTQVEYKIKEKGSLFHCVSKPVENESEAIEFLSSLKKEFYDATHHCYAYKLQDGAFKYSDDGEPSGTAGIRIYNAQNYFELTNIISVVIRYYGGTKLGVGPLGKAYYDATFECLSSSKQESKTLYQKIEIIYDFRLSKTVHHFANKFKLIISNNDFDSLPKMICLIQPRFEKDFSSELINSTQGKVKIITRNEFFYLIS